MTTAHDVVVTFALDTYTWYLAEGCTAGGTETWVLVENVNPYPVTLDISFATAEGLFTPAALQGYKLAAELRVSFDAGTYVESYELSTIVSATGGERGLRAGHVRKRPGLGHRLHRAPRHPLPPGTWPKAVPGRASRPGCWCRTPAHAAVTVDLTFMTSTGEQNPGPAGRDHPRGGTRLLQAQ